MKETAANKPRISEEARGRICAFVSEVAALQKMHGVEIRVQDDSIALRDTRRKATWGGYGHWDAYIFNAAAGDSGRMRVRDIHFEDFDAWGD